MATQTIDTAEDLLHFQLRTALTMEDHSLAALGTLASATKSAEIKKMFRHHADETKEQIENLHKVFKVLDLKPTTAPSPSTTGISKQAESLIHGVGSCRARHGWTRAHRVLRRRRRLSCPRAARSLGRSWKQDAQDRC